MSKELEALKNIKHYDSRIGLHESDYKTIETALKAFEIIKKYYEVNYDGTDLQIIPQNLTDLKQYYADMELLQELML